MLFPLQAHPDGPTDLSRLLAAALWPSSVAGARVCPCVPLRELGLESAPLAGRYRPAAAALLARGPARQRFGSSLHFAPHHGGGRGVRPPAERKFACSTNDGTLCRAASTPSWPLPYDRARRLLQERPELAANPVGCRCRRRQREGRAGDRTEGLMESWGTPRGHDPPVPSKPWPASGSKHRLAIPPSAARTPPSPTCRWLECSSCSASNGSFRTVHRFRRWGAVPAGRFSQELLRAFTGSA